jgi:hypothetical protein
MSLLTDAIPLCDGTYANGPVFIVGLVVGTVVGFALLSVCSDVAALYAKLLREACCSGPIAPVVDCAGAGAGDVVDSFR